MLPSYRFKILIPPKREKASQFLACSSFCVRVKGLEPSRLAAPDPKSGVSTNSTTPAKRCAKVNFYLISTNFFQKKMRQMQEALGHFIEEIFLISKLSFSWLLRSQQCSVCRSKFQRPTHYHRLTGCGYQDPSPRKKSRSQPYQSCQLL